MTIIEIIEKIRIYKKRLNMDLMKILTKKECKGNKYIMILRGNRFIIFKDENSDEKHSKILSYLRCFLYRYFLYMFLNQQ